jgi:hypothetical protein
MTISNLRRRKRLKGWGGKKMKMKEDNCKMKGN